MLYLRQILEATMRIPLMTLLAATALMAQVPLSYPETRRDAVVDDYFGTKVADPYRWQEDDNAPDTKAWVEAQNKVTRAYLDAIPERRGHQGPARKLWNYERFGVPFKRGGPTSSTAMTDCRTKQCSS